MDARRSFENDTAAKQRLTGEPSARQILVLIGVSAFVAGSGLAFVDVALVTRMVLMVPVMLVVTLIGRAVIRRVNLRRHR